MSTSTLPVISPNASPEYQILTHVGTLPDATSRRYVQVTEVDGRKIVFNNGGNDAKPIQTRVVTITGVKVIFEDAAGSDTLFNQFDDRTNIERFEVCADEIVIRGPLRLPGTEVHLHARILRFEDRGGKHASVDTTPRSVGIRSNRFDAYHGAGGGDIHLHVRKIEGAGGKPRFIARGGKGQDAQLGKKGADGANVDAWDGKVDTQTSWGGWEELDWNTPEIRDHCGDHKVIYGKLQMRFGLQESIWDATVWMDGTVYEVGQGGWPGDGKKPEIMPGRPGRGGDGGSVYAADVQSLKGLTELPPGQVGAKAENLAASKPGEPIKSCSVWMMAKQYDAPIVGGIRAPGDGILNRKREFSVSEWHEAKGSAAVTAPGPDERVPAGRAGKHLALDPRLGTYWLHHLSARAVTSYVRDAYLAGHTDTVRPLIDEYLETMGVLLQSDHAPIEIRSVHTELAELVRRIDGPLDFFGNPVGWVPALSFQSNLAAFQQETRSAMDRLYLSYWMEHNQARKEQRVAAIQKALAHLREESIAAVATYNETVSLVIELGEEQDAIQRQITTLVGRIGALERDLRVRAEGDLAVEKVLRSSAMILGGVAQIIPAGQPAMAAFGKGLSVLADIDLDKPFDTVKDIASAVWDSKLIQDVALPKLTDKAKSYFEIKDDPETEKDAFTKEVEKQELSAKAKKHIKAGQDARAQITTALGAFMASEEEIEAAVSKALANSPEFKEVAEELQTLNDRKAVFAAQLLAALHVLEDASTTLVLNRLTAIELRGDLASSLEGLSPEARRLTRTMGERALERLRRYQYYFVRSYLYLWLKQPPNVDTNAEFMFNELKRVLQPTDGGLLTEAQFKVLRTVFEENLRNVGDEVLRFYNTVLPTQGGKHPSVFRIELTPAQLAALNSEARQVMLDPMAEGKIHLSLEDVRLFDVSVVEAELVDPPRDAPEIRVRVEHPGFSLLRRDAKVYAFGNTGRSWDTQVRHTNAETHLEVQEPDAMDESLIRHLLGMESAKSPLLSRPSAWSPLVIRRQVMDMKSRYAGQFSKLALDVRYTARDADAKQASLFVSVPGGVTPRIDLDKRDLNERTSGRGSFLRTYRQGTTVTLTAPESFGQHVFLGWRTRSRENANDPTQLMPLLTPEDAAALGNPDDLVREATLTLKLDTHVLVEAIYLQPAQARTNGHAG